MTRRDAPGGTLARRLGGIEWGPIEESLRAQGWAETAPVLSPQECAALVASWDGARRFRARIDMARLRFGVGEYRYFAAPLPPIVQTLRTTLYAGLAPIANRWAAALHTADRYPPRLPAFLARCRAHGQRKPTPLLLRYGAGGYNCLHRDLYGDVAFPLQVTAFLSRVGTDHGGGEFLLVEQRPRCQSRGEVIVPPQGALLIFPNATRPVASARGVLRAGVRHGVSRVRWGERWALGIIFHDAR